MSKREIAIIKTPLWQGCNHIGIEQAPTLLANMLVESVHKDAIADVVSIRTTPTLEDELPSEGVKHLRSIVSTNHGLLESVREQLAKGRLVITLGGDHALGLGSVAGSLAADQNVGLIWFDAHGDMNTESSSPTGNTHGMPIAALLGLCHSKLNDVPTQRIKPENIFWIGTRSLDEGEIALAEKLHLNIYTTEQIHQIGMQAVIQEVRDNMHQLGIVHVHLSFDVDALDPQIFPATGVPVPNGLNIEDFDSFCELLPELPTIQALDFVEYNPLLDNEHKDCEKLCKYLLNRLLTAISKQEE